MKRAGVVLVAVAALFVLPATGASAHPLGNFTINTFSGIRAQPRAVLVHYVVDMAEIPTFQERARLDADGDGRIGVAEAAAYSDRTCAALAKNITLDVGGSRVSPSITGSDARLLPGAAGLQTLRLECELRAALAPRSGAYDLRYRDGNFPGRVGWHEITLVGDRVTLVQSSVPASSVSAELTHYPTDLLQSPLEVREATARVRPGGAAGPSTERIATPALLPRGLDAATRAFTSFLGRRHLTAGFAILALVIAVGLGAIHALGPGHGKTVMAAYLVGQRGTLRQGALIALTVTVTHTAGVLALGLFLSLSASAATERVYPVLGLASGAMLAAIGGSLLRRAIRARRAAGMHDHGHEHLHERPVGTRTLAGMGFAGGLVPSPSAVVVLLGAIALRRAWLGVALVVAYGAGMALTLSGAGLLLTRVRSSLERRSAGGRAGRFDAAARAVPVLTAAIIVTVGLTLAARGFSQI